MLFFFGEGRLGNQVLQHQLLMRLGVTGETVLAAGLEQLPDVFERVGARLLVLTRSRTAKRIVKHLLMPFVVRPLARDLRLFNYVHEPLARYRGTLGHSGDYRIRAGLLRWVTVVDGGYFQNGAIPLQRFPLAGLRLRGELLARARAFLYDARRGRELDPVFVHVRRGDYANFTDYGLTDLVLPDTYYRNAIEEARTRVERPLFVFVTDDHAWVERTFADVAPRAIVAGDAALDFAVMTQCAGGIVSNSTFSLAAALMMERPRLVLGPHYWFGFRVREWYPPRIRVDDPRVHYLQAM